MDALFDRFGLGRRQNGKRETNDDDDLSAVPLAIAPANLADVPALVDMHEQSGDRSVFFQALYSLEEPSVAHRHWRRDITEYRLMRAIERPDHVLLVAKHPASGRPVGCLGFEPVTAREVPEGKPGPDAAVASFKYASETTRQRIEDVWERVAGMMHAVSAGREHISCSIFEVLQQHRGQGVEARLLDHALAQRPSPLGGDARPILVWPFVLGGQLDVLASNGWSVASHLEIDLAEWTVAPRGYGVYHIQALLREDGGAGAKS